MFDFPIFCRPLIADALQYDTYLLTAVEYSVNAGGVKQERYLCQKLSMANHRWDRSHPNVDVSGSELQILFTKYLYNITSLYRTIWTSMNT